jgi:hypothetical protein
MPVQARETTDFLTRIDAVLHRHVPDRIPFAPYDNLVPRGEFARGLENRGMGCCYRRSTVYAETPNVSIETRTKDGVGTTIYHTPVGDVSTRTSMHAGRISDSLAIETEGLIKTVEDYDPVIFMIEDTEFGIDTSVYDNTVRDIGGDGIVRDTALDYEASPYGATKRYFGEVYGMDQWVYHQTDHPEHFGRLLDAQIRRDERRLTLVAESPAEFLGFGWIEGVWSPAQFRKWELPFYRKWVPYLQSRGKILAVHCDVTRGLQRYKEVIAETGIDVVEAFTPPPISDLPLAEAREAWPNIVIWVNMPETIFWSGPEATKQYTADLLRSAPEGDRLVLGFTEMGTWAATDDVTERCFKAGTLAVMDAIDEHARDRRLTPPGSATS